MMYIASRISTGTVLEIAANSLALDGADRDRFLDALAANHGGAKADIDLFTIDEKDPAAIALMSGASYTLARTAGRVTGIDLAAENAKRIVKASASKATLLADGADSVTITIEVWKANGSGIDKAVTASSDIPILTPDGRKTVRASVVNGSVSRVFSTMKVGTWEIPLNLPRFGGVRVASVARFESVASFASL